MVLVLPSLPVPEITTASGAGRSCAESHTRSLLSNQRTLGTGRRHGNSMLISESGTLAGRDAMSCGGGPKTVARRPAESERPTKDPETGADPETGCEGGVSPTCAAQAAVAATPKAAGNHFNRATF